MKPYLVYIIKNNFDGKMLFRNLSKKGYKFLNNMTERVIIINPRKKYAFCICKYVFINQKLYRWVLKNCIPYVKKEHSFIHSCNSIYSSN